MNIWIKSLTALTLFSGAALLDISTAAAAPVASITLPAPAPAQAALNTLTSRADSPLPSGTTLRSIRIADGLATVDFARELRDNFSGGDLDEANTVNAILRTLGQFPTISRVQLLVAGKPLDSLGGLLDLSSPLPVIRPNASAGSIPASRRWLHRKPHPTSKTDSALSTDEIN